MIWIPTLLWLAVVASGAEGDPVARQPAIGYVEAGGSHAELSSGNASWNDQYLRGSVQVRPPDRVNLELSHQRHFGEGGTFFGLGYTRALDDVWYATVNGGTSDRGIFLPRVRLDGSVSRKWLERRQLVTTLGGMFLRSRGPYHDLGLLLGATYYFEAPWIVEAAARITYSNPGSVRSTRGLLAVTEGRDKRHFVTLKVEGGNEAWQILGTETVLVDFPSVETTLVWRQWLGGAFGVNVRVAHYRNRNYVRTAGDVGVFREF